MNEKEVACFMAMIPLAELNVESERAGDQQQLDLARAVADRANAIVAIIADGVKQHGRLVVSQFDL